MLALIPARAGSKGLPEKNVKPLLGKPLIQYTIEAALKSHVADRVVVSSDDPRVLSIAEAMGVTPLSRPAELAGDATPMNDVITHAWEAFPSQHLALLYPTAPLRDAVHIAEAWMLYQEKGRGSLLSVTEIKTAPWGGLLMKDDGVVHPLVPGNKAYRRQDMPMLYRANGAMYLFDKTAFPTLSTMLVCEDSVGFVMDNDRSVDVDTPTDFAMAEFLLQQGYVSLRHDLGTAGTPTAVPSTSLAMGV